MDDCLWLNIFKVCLKVPNLLMAAGKRFYNIQLLRLPKSNLVKIFLQACKCKIHLWCFSLFNAVKKINESNFMFIDFKYGRNLDVFNLIKALGTHGLLGACSWFQQKKKKFFQSKPFIFPDVGCFVS